MILLLVIISPAVFSDDDQVISCKRGETMTVHCAQCAVEAVDLQYFAQINKNKHQGAGAIENSKTQKIQHIYLNAN